MVSLILSLMCKTNHSDRCGEHISDILVQDLVDIIFIILELTHKDLITYVAPHVTTKLQEIGTALVLAPPELDDTEENHQGITGVFQIWYETKRCPYT